MSLSDTACHNAHKSDKAKDGKAFKLFDDKGLAIKTLYDLVWEPTSTYK